MIYIFGYILLFITALFFKRNKLITVKTYSVLVILFFFIPIAAFRGDIGTDTETYFRIVNSLINNDILTNAIEPGFTITTSFLLYITSDAEIIVRMYSLIFFSLVMYYIIKSDSNELYYIMCFYAPTVFYQYSMNGLRIGISSIFFLLFLQNLARKEKIKSALLGSLSASFHLSIVLAFISVWLSQIKLLVKSNLIISVLFIFILGLIVYLAEEQIQFKLDSYGELTQNLSLSGLGLFIPIILVNILALKSRLSKIQRQKLFYISNILLLLSYFLSIYTYAGLRFLDVLRFLLPALILYSHQKEELLYNKYTRSSFVISALISAIFTFRNIVSTIGTEGAYLPYYFYWE